MNDVRVAGRACGVGDAPEPAGTARMCGGRDNAALPPVVPARRGRGFTIRPTRPGHRRSLTAALRMGHCAPATMAALIDEADPGRESAVLLASAMAGGIGNTGRECGALTSAVLSLGDRYGRAREGDGIPAAIALSRRLIDRFREVHGGIHCEDIRKKGKNPLPCMRAMVSAPDLLSEVIGQRVPPADDAGLGCHAQGLLSVCEARPFHCAHGVFAGLSGIVPECSRLSDMTYPLIGGFALSGGTCTAAAAGVLAIGLATGRIEDSYLRVVGMLTRMVFGGDTMMMADSVNNFNPAINRGQALMEWFAQTYGSVSCSELTGVTIRESEKAGRDFMGGGIERCEAIAVAVATKAREIIEGVRQ